MVNYQQQMLGKGVKKMPKVGNKKFDYTAKGIAAARKESAKTGIPMSDGSMRSVQKYAGGGEVGYSRIGADPIPEPEYRGQSFERNVQEWKDVGEVTTKKKKKSLKDRIKGVANKLKSINAKKSLKTYKDGKVEKKATKQASKNMEKINKMAASAEKEKKGSGLDTVKRPKNVDPAKIKATGKIRKKPQPVTMTEGGAYPTYKKKSKPAKSFRKAFAEARSADKKTFMWDGRKYSTKVK